MLSMGKTARIVRSSLRLGRRCCLRVVCSVRRPRWIHNPTFPVASSGSFIETVPEFRKMTGIASDGPTFFVSFWYSAMLRFRIIDLKSQLFVKYRTIRKRNWQFEKTFTKWKSNLQQFKEITSDQVDTHDSWIGSGYCSHTVIGHFRVPKTLTFKMRPRAQPFLWKWFLFAWE